MVTETEYLTSRETLEQLCKTKPKRFVRDAIADMTYDTILTLVGSGIGAGAGFGVAKTWDDVSNWADAASKLNSWLHWPTVVGGYGAEAIMGAAALGGGAVGIYGLLDIALVVKSLITGRDKSANPENVFAFRSGRYIRAPSNNDLMYGTKINPVDNLEQLEAIPKNEDFFANGFVITEISRNIEDVEGVTGGIIPNPHGVTTQHLTPLKGYLNGEELVAVVTHKSPEFAAYASAELLDKPHDIAPVFILGRLARDKRGTSYLSVTDFGDALTR